jgi:hypothetical protein
MQKAVVQTKIKLAMTMIENENFKVHCPKTPARNHPTYKAAEFDGTKGKFSFPFLFFLSTVVQMDFSIEKEPSP